MPKKKKKNPQPPPPAPPVDSCKYCQRSHLKLLKCSRCKDVFYCSTECQKEDWIDHKTTCKPKTSEQQSPDPPFTNKVPEESCNNCGKSDVKLSKCSKCHNAKYCSKECQRAEWTKHKVDCKKNSDLASHTPQMFQDQCRICLDACGDSGYCKNCIGIKLMGNLFPLEVPVDIYQKAKRIYRGFELITEFEDIEPIDPYTYGTNKQVLLVLLFEPGGHPGRPCMDVRDETKMVYPLIFYLDHDDTPTENFRDKFMPGNYICIPYPLIHTFLSGFDGFRIESTKAVGFIESW